MSRRIFQKGDGEIGTIIVLGLIIWGAFALFGGDTEKTVIMEEHPNYATYERKPRTAPP